MITANNGILIVALIFGWGLHSNDGRLMALALVSAVASWVVNAVNELSKGFPSFVGVLTIWTGAVVSIGAVVLALSPIVFRM